MNTKLGGRTYCCKSGSVRLGLRSYSLNHTPTFASVEFIIKAGYSYLPGNLPGKKRKVAAVFGFCYHIFTFISPST